MSRKDVLYELMSDNSRRVHDLLDNGPVEMLYWLPDGEGNNIAVTIWHTSRVSDLFLNQHVKGTTAVGELWFASGWAQKTGYDPRGIGTNGWGMLTGYSADEVKAIPRFRVEDLKGYYDEVMAHVRAYLEQTPDEVLDQTAVGYGGKQTNYFWIRHPLFDLTRHVGEMLAIKAMWERKEVRGG